MELAGAEVAQALVARELASLDLECTLVVAPADGILSDPMLQVGDAVTNVTPTVRWVRLAQRVPVRVTLDAVPPGIRLIVGRTATVTILPGVDTD